MIVTFLIAGFSVAGMAQANTKTTKKEEPAKMQVVKKTTDKKEEIKTSTEKKAPIASVPLKKEPVQTPANGPMKKDGTPDKRFKSNQAKTEGPVKKDGTKDMRYKANKKHS